MSEIGLFSTVGGAAHRCPSNGLALESLTVALCLGEEEPHLGDGRGDCCCGLGVPLSQSYRTIWMAGKRKTIRGL
jgi:hypothetical protein